MKVKHFTLDLKTKNPLKIYRNSLELEKIIRENIVEISNDVKMDPTEVFFNN